MTLALRRTLLVLVLGLLAASTADAQQVIFLVRHAEKIDSSSDAALSPAGVERAQRLAAVLASSGVQAVFATQYQRTIKTAEPLAHRMKLPVVSVPAADGAILVARLRASHPADRVLIVGHSNSVPELLRLLGHPTHETIADDDFGSLFVVVPAKEGPPLVMRLRY